MPMELMSPAGSLEGVIAAVRGGADAVYFGTGDFNARRNAKNLEGDDLAEALRYCRLRGVRTYVTVNTLVTDRELSRAREMILQLGPGAFHLRFCVLEHSGLVGVQLHDARIHLIADEQEHIHQRHLIGADVSHELSVVALLRGVGGIDHLRQIGRAHV